jgi:hypothetical protein
MTLKGSTPKTVTQPPLQSYGGRIDVLNGLNHATLISPTDYWLGADDDPAAIKTRLGWTILGVLGSEPTTSALCHHAFASSDVLIVAELADQLRFMPKVAGRPELRLVFRRKLLSTVGQASTTTPS